MKMNSITENIENGNLKLKDIILYAGLLVLLGFIIGKAAAPINITTSFGSNNGNTYLGDSEDEKCKKK